MVRNEKQKTMEKGLLRSDFSRYFIFYFTIIIVFILLAYSLSFLPSFLAKNQNLDQSETIQQMQQSKDQDQYYTERNKCIESMTSGSENYDVSYKIFINGTESGSLFYNTVKEGSNYVRTVTHFVNISKISKQNLNNSGAEYGNSIHDSIEFKIIMNYDSSFNCKNSIYSIQIGGQEYHQEYPCVSSDIPFQICKENLTEVKTYSLSLKIGEFNVKEYILKGSKNLDSSGYAYSDLYVVFSDLPFPLIINSSEMTFEIMNYSKINYQ